MRFRIDVSPSLPAMLVLAVFLTACGEMPTAPDGADHSDLVQPANLSNHVDLTAELTGIVDFQSLATATGGPFNLESYSEEGLTLTSDQGANGLSYVAEDSPFYVGSTALYLGLPNSTMTMTRDDGGAFDVLTIDVAEHWPSTLPFPPSPVTLRAVGSVGGVEMVDTVLVTDGVLGLETFDLVGFEAVETFALEQAGQLFQFDNIDFFFVDGTDPATLDDCTKDGWEAFGFKNQGQCVRFVKTGKDSR